MLVSDGTILKRSEKLDICHADKKCLNYVLDGINKGKGAQLIFLELLML